MIGGRIKGLRESRGLTQTELGNAIGFSKMTVYSWESGVRGLNLGTISVLADFFETSTDYLLGRTDDPRPVSEIVSKAEPLCPEPMTLASRKANNSDPDVSEERMDEIIIQAYKLIMARRKHDS